MVSRTKAVVLSLLLIAAWAGDVGAEKKTVCTITVNSPDEKEVFRRHLSRDQFDFVELVERGRPDWLASACRKGIRCDVLLISGHFDDGTEFYSDRLDAREFLPVDELQRVACSDSCPGLFAQLREVYLFGCNTLDPQGVNSASADVVRSLVRAGHTPDEAAQLARRLGELHGESNRDHMRRIFKDVPVIYGFSAKAPLGAAAAPTLERYFRSESVSEVGSGRASARLLNLFAPSSMTLASGASDSDPQAQYRRDVCHFYDDRLSPAQKIGFVHELLDRDAAEVRMFLDQIEKYSASLSESARASPPVAQALAQIAGDAPARARYLELARDAEETAVRARMIALARTLGWLSPQEEREEIVRMLAERLTRDSVSAAEVELACSLNKKESLGRELDRLQVSPGQPGSVPNAAVLACLGSPDGRARMLSALSSPRDEDVQIAQVYFRHHPLVDPSELRNVATRVARMSGAAGQARALDTLARYQFSDREILDELVRVFPITRSLDVQRAIAGILIRADYRALATPEFVRSLRQNRVKSSDGEDLIDVLIRRLQAP